MWLGTMWEGFLGGGCQRDKGMFIHWAITSTHSICHISSGPLFVLRTCLGLCHSRHPAIPLIAPLPLLSFFRPFHAEPLCPPLASAQLACCDSTTTATSRSSLASLQWSTSPTIRPVCSFFPSVLYTMSHSCLSLYYSWVHDLHCRRWHGNRIRPR